MEIYFDNAATTQCLKSVADIMAEVFLKDYGNPSSMHRKGLEAEIYIKQAKEQIAKTLKISGKELIFTSGGTEAVNLAVIGSAMANKRAGMHLITTKIEHPAVLDSMAFLEGEGFTVTYLDVDKDGMIRLDQLKAALTKETILVSIMYVNNEIGAVQPIKEAGKLIKEANPATLFHVDAIQAYGKYMIYPKREGIDLMSVSGHKIHGPKGVGFLFVKEKTKIKPILFGGGQQGGLRSGTENVAGIAGLLRAAEESYENFYDTINHLYEIKEYFCNEIKDNPWAHMNGKIGRESAPHIVSVSFDGVKAEVLLHALEDRGIYVSAGSACASNKPAVSNTLKNMGIRSEYLASTLRFSFSKMNTREEVQYCIQTLKELVPMLQKYTRH
ncbi:cysteine desulfurase [Lachnospiraceae bacterium ZAX-1]